MKDLKIIYYTEILDFTLKFIIERVTATEKFQYENFLNNVKEFNEQKKLKELKNYYKFICTPMLKENQELQLLFREKIGFIPLFGLKDKNAILLKIMKERKVETEEEYKIIEQAIEEELSKKDSTKNVFIDSLNKLLIEFENQF